MHAQVGMMQPRPPACRGLSEYTLEGRTDQRVANSFIRYRFKNRTPQLEPSNPPHPVRIGRGYAGRHPAILLNSNLGPRLTYLPKILWAEAVGCH